MPITYSQATDGELIHLVQQKGAKDNRAFAELFHRYQDYVYRQCYRSFGNSQDAEDLTQEIFFRAYRGLPRFAGRSSFKTWLFEITLNTCRNEMRRRARRPVSHDEQFEDLEKLDLLPKRNLVIAQGQREKVEEALLGLSVAERQVLILKDLEGFSYNEIAEAQNISISAAKMRVMRGRLAFRTLLAEQELNKEVE